MRVKVVIPVYNERERYLQRCINSVLAQSPFSEIDLVVVDDGSMATYPSLEGSRYMAEYLVTHEENIGVCRTLNEQLKDCNSDYFTFLASDNYYIDENTINILLNAMASGKYSMAYSAYNVVYKAQAPLIMHPGQHTIETLLKNSNLGICWLMDTKLAQKHMFDCEYIHAHDYDLYLKLIKEKPFVYVDKVLGHMRSHSGRITKQYYDGYNVRLHTELADIRAKHSMIVDSDNRSQL